MFGKKKSTKKTQLEFTRSVKAHKPVEENIVYEDEFFEYVEVDESVAEDYQDDFEESGIPQFYQGNFPAPRPPYFVPPPQFYPHYITIVDNCKYIKNTFSYILYIRYKTSTYKNNK